MGVAVGLGTAVATTVATANPFLGAAAGTAVGGAASFQTGIALRIMDCLGNPGQCSLSSA